MLTELHIENIAVIERADISFMPGLNVLCGETGSGKSIVIDSLNAVLGSRTSRELVRHGAEKALVTAVFGPSYYSGREDNFPYMRDTGHSSAAAGAGLSTGGYPRPE